MSRLFPTFAKSRKALRQLLPVWLSTPWWSADSLASKQRALLRVLSVATSERLEQAPLVACLAEEHRGRYRRRLKRLAKRLGAGTPLPDALEQTPGSLTDEQVLSIRFGIQSGTLTQSLRTLIEQDGPAEHRIGYRLRQIGFYALGVCLVFLIVLAFLIISIIPSFQKIFSDFDLSLSEPTHLLIRLSTTAVNYWPLIVLGLLLVVWLFWSEISRRFFRRRVMSRVLRPIGQLRSANLLQQLAVAQQAGRPLAGAISTLARYHYDSRLRQKLLYVRNEMEQGAQIWKSMASARLIQPVEASAIEEAAKTDSLSWTLRHLAKWKRSRVARRFDCYIDILQPLAVLLMASIVLLVAVGTLSPIFNLSNALSG